MKDIHIESLKSAEFTESPIFREANEEQRNAVACFAAALEQAQASCKEQMRQMVCWLSLCRSCCTLVTITLHARLMSSVSRFLFPHFSLLDV